MSEEVSKQKVIIDDKEYLVEDLSNEQKVIISHITDLDRKINSTRFNLEQLSVGRDSFMSMLKQSLEQVDDKAA